MSHSLMKLEFHPVANLFPPPSEDDYKAIKEDIKQQGQTVPIPLFQGKAIDGRTRYRICEELGIEFRTEEVEVPGSLVTYNVSLNEKRRHLTASQRATVAVEIAKELAREAAQRKKLGKSQDGTSGGRARKKNLPQQAGAGKDRTSKNAKDASKNAKDASKNAKDTGKTSKHAGEAAEQAAKMAGTNRQYVADAKRIQKVDPDLFDKVRNGEVKMPEAKRILKQQANGEAPVTASVSALKDIAFALKGVTNMLTRNAPLVEEHLPSFDNQARAALILTLGTIVKQCQDMIAKLDVSNTVPTKPGSNGAAQDKEAVR